MRTTLLLALLLLAPLALPSNVSAAGFCTNVAGSTSCPDTFCWDYDHQRGYWRHCADDLIVCVRECGPPQLTP